MPMPSMPDRMYRISAVMMAPASTKKKAAAAPAWKPVIAVTVIQLGPFWYFRPYCSALAGIIRDRRYQLHRRRTVIVWSAENGRPGVQSRSRGGAAPARRRAHVRVAFGEEAPQRIVERRQQLAPFGGEDRARRAHRCGGREFGLVFYAATERAGEGCS